MSFVQSKVRTMLALLTLLMIAHPYSSVSASGLGQPSLAARGAAKNIQPQPAAKTHLVQRVFTPGVLDLTVVQQPAGQSMYVSAGEAEATQFRLASRYGNIGLLAHDYLAGSAFSQLAVGTIVHLTYTDGEVESYMVSQVLRYEALRPDSTLSAFRDLASGQIVSASRLFSSVYAGRHHLTFPTCITNLGDLNWGRLFVIAVPVTDYTHGPN